MPYIYQADQFCDDCIAKILPDLKKPDYSQPWDTDDYPMHVGDCGESDTPCNCGQCGKPLDYSLTDDGVKYVLESIRESLESAVEHGRKNTWDRIMPASGTAEEEMSYWRGSRHVEIVREWAKTIRDYSLESDEQALVDLFLELSE